MKRRAVQRAVAAGRAARVHTGGLPRLALVLAAKAPARTLRLGRVELPPLVNALRGEVSPVGPRPDHVLPRADCRRSDYVKLAMRPGITSLAQVPGRNRLPWREGVALGAEYVQRFSLWLDLRIACRTAGVVVRGTGLFDPALPEEADLPSPPQAKDVAQPAD